MDKVFICYSRQDRAFVEAFTADLRQRKVSTWLDTEDIPGHVSANTAGWRQAVQEGLQQCSHMIVILSPDAVASLEVQAEWNYFLSRKRPIFPVLCRECQVPYRLYLLQLWNLNLDDENTMGRFVKLLPRSEASESGIPSAELTEPLPQPGPRPRRTALLKTLEGHADAVTSVSMSWDGRRAVSGSADRTVRLWDLETGKCLKTLAGHTGSLLGVSMSWDGRRAVSGGYDQTIRLWDLEAEE